MTVRIPFKRGDTFLVQSTVTVGGVAQDLTGWSIRSHVRNGETQVAALDVEYTDRAAGVFRLRKDVTTDWPVKVLTCDIEYTKNDGTIMSTETFEINCLKDETR